MSHQIFLALSSLQFSFDNGATFGTSATSGALTAGTYQVKVRNAAGCESAPTPITINTQPATPAAPTATTVQPTCAVATGTITVTSPTGAGLQFSFDNGATFGTSATSGALAAGNYQVKVKNADGCESAPTPIELKAALSCFGSIGDVVFLDNDNSNTQSAGDSPIDGVRVYLLNAAGAKIDSTLTANGGKYLFANLPLGTYSVQFVAPAGQGFVTALAGTDPTKDSDAGVNGITSQVTLTTTTPDVLTLDAGIKPAPAAPLGSIGDVVFLDNDNSNTQSAGDSPIDGVRVYLLNAAGAKIDSTLTANGGKYLFANLPLGTYSVQFVAPAGQGFVTALAGADPTKDSDAGANGTTSQVTLTTTTPNVLTLDAGIKPTPAAPLGSIGDVVFLDNDNSNTQTAGDSPIDGVRVYLLNAAGAKIDSALTANGGKYLFANLPLGTYSVQFVAPAGQGFVTALAGTDPTKDSDAGVNGITNQVTLTTTTPDVLTLDAGIKPTPAAPLGSIGDVVFLDNDNSNTQSAGDSPIDGVRVYLLNAAGAKIDSTLTANGGKYLFANLPLGTYSVQFVAPAGQGFVTALAGADPTKDSDAGVNGITSQVALTTTTPNVLTLDAGIKPTPAAPLGSIGDVVFLDNDNSNTQSAGDSPIDGVRVYLLNAAGTRIDSTLTANGGKYLFANLPLGTYSVQFVAPAGQSFVTALAGADPTKDSDAGANGTTSQVTLTTTTSNVLTLDAGVKPTPAAPLGSIGDVVFLDNDNSNTQSAGDSPIDGVRVYLLNAAGAKIDSTLTANGGKYLFANLPLGTYSVQFVAPAGQGFVTALAGADPTKDSDAGANGITSQVTLTTTTPNVLTLDAGIKPTPAAPLGSIGDVVFLDRDSSNSQTAGDLTLDGVRVYLLNASGVKIDSTLTANGGKYLFANLTSGIYRVQFKTPIGFLPVAANVGTDNADSDAGAGGLTHLITIDFTKAATDTLRNNPNIDAGFRNDPTGGCPVAAPSVLASSVVICSGDLIPDLVVSVNPGVETNWYSAATNGVLLAANTSRYRPTAPGTYYVEAKNVSGNCVSATRTAVMLSVSDRVLCVPITIRKIK